MARRQCSVQVEFQWLYPRQTGVEREEHLTGRDINVALTILGQRGDDTCIERRDDHKRVDALIVGVELSEPRQDAPVIGLHKTGAVAPHVVITAEVVGLWAIEAHAVLSAYP